MIPRRRVVAGLAVSTLLLASVAAAIEPDRSRWPSGVELVAVEADGSRTFSIERGEEVIFQRDVARPGDFVVCEGEGSVMVGALEAGIRTSGRVDVSIDPSEAMRVSCEPGSPRL